MLYLIGGFLLVLLLVVSWLLFREWSKRFPRLEVGSYVGVLRGYDSGRGDSTEKKRSVKLYIERGAGSEELLVVVLRTGWEPEIISGVLSDAGSPDSDLLPILVKGDDEELTLTGSKVEKGKYAGWFTGKNRKGSWELNQVSPELQSGESDERKDARLWLLLQAELLDVETKVEEAENLVPQQRAELERLTSFITEGERLKAKANEKFSQLNSDLERVKKELRERQAEGKKLEQTLEVSQKVSGMGKLVALSRESLEREGRWIDSMLKPYGGQPPEDLEGAVERGEKIQELKREIALEKGKIERLLNRPAVTIGGGEG